MDEDKIKKLLYADCNKEANRKAVQQTLHKFKPMRKYQDDVPLTVLEKFVKVISAKYGIIPQWIMIDTVASDRTLLYSCTILKGSAREPLHYISGSSLYELFAKLSIGMAFEAMKTKKGQR